MGAESGSDKELFQGRRCKCAFKNRSSPALERSIQAADGSAKAATVFGMVITLFELFFSCGCHRVLSRCHAFRVMRANAEWLWFVLLFLVSFLFFVFWC